MADGFHIDEDRLWRLVCSQDSTYQLVKKKADETCSKANALSAGFRTGIYHDHQTGETKGDTQPSYGSHTGRPRGVVPVGIVHPANYAAMKDNHLHNTLLKSL